jgi:hypothetical protein
MGHDISFPGKKHFEIMLLSYFLFPAILAAKIFLRRHAFTDLAARLWQLMYVS